MSIPIIGQQQGPPVEITVSLVPPILFIGQGIMQVKVPLTLEMATGLRGGLDQVIATFRPENGSASPAANPFRRESG